LSKSAVFYFHFLTRCRIFLQLLYELFRRSVDCGFSLVSNHEALIICVHYSDTWYQWPGPQPAWDTRRGEKFSERGPNFL